MRMRKKRNGDKRLRDLSDLIIKSRAEIVSFPVSLEIGCGKGAFIAELAKREPDKSFIAVEKCSDVAVLAAENVARAGIGNVRFIVGDAAGLGDYFEKGDVERIYLNFSDPWKKSGQFKRRLTYRSFLAVYKSILCDGGSIFFKTDNEPLFDFSLEEFEFSGFELRGVTRDLHASEFAADNIMTEYEKNFSSRGFRINRCEAFLPANANPRLRPATADDLPDAGRMFDDAREYLGSHGVDQWQDGYPPRELLEEDVALGAAYVVEIAGRPVAYAALRRGEDPTYRVIRDGAWPDEKPYATVHRMVVDRGHKGTGLAAFVFGEFARICRGEGLGALRCDTHRDNRSMRRALEKNGFAECGTIYLESGAARVAYHKPLN